MTNKATGRITQIMGAVIDVQFTGELPSIMSALTVDNQFVPLPWTLLKVCNAAKR
jgi:F0F1-type ATP synthase beta subunit